MFIYNITFVVHQNFAEHFESWLKNKEIFFERQSISVQPLRIHTQVDEGHLNYSLQINLDTIEKLEHFQSSEFGKLINEKSRLFGENVLNFETILERF